MSFWLRILLGIFDFSLYVIRQKNLSYFARTSKAATVLQIAEVSVCRSLNSDKCNTSEDLTIHCLPFLSPENAFSLSFIWILKQELQISHKDKIYGFVPFWPACELKREKKVEEGEVFTLQIKQFFASLGDILEWSWRNANCSRADFLVSRREERGVVLAGGWKFFFLLLGNGI